MRCGDRGHVTASGQPCGQTISAKAQACIWHSKTPAERSVLALKGSIASRMNRALPATLPEPPFDTVDNIVTWSQQMAKAALTEDVDPRRLAEARGFAQLALSALAQRTQARLVDALTALESGGAAVALLAQFTNAQATGKRKPLPGPARVISLPSEPVDPA